jgi:hypothetical protein
MRRPQEYVDLLDRFMALDAKKAVKLEKLTAEDAACLTVAAYCKELPIEVLINKKEKHIILLRKDEDESQAN